MRKNPYEFRLKNADGQFYYVNGSTVDVTTDEAVALLQESVISWDNLALDFNRNPDRHGVFSKRAPETVQFCNHAAMILRHVFTNLGGVDAKCAFDVRRLKSTNQQYYSEGDWDINFATFRSTKLYVEVALIEGGIYNDLIAKDTVDYAIALGVPGVDPDSHYVYMDGVVVLGSVNFQTIKEQTQIVGVNYILPIAYINTEGEYQIGIANQNTVFTTEWEGGDFDSAYQYKTTLPFRGKVKVNLSFKVLSFNYDPSLELWIDIRGKKPDVDLLHTEKLSSTIDCSTLGDKIVVGEMADFFNFNTENYIILYWKKTGSDMAAYANIRFPTIPGTVTIDYQYRQAPTITRAIRLYELYRKVVYKATGADFASNLLLASVDPSPNERYDLNPRNIWVTCGDSLRGLPTAAGIALGDGDPAIKTNLKQLRELCMYMLCGGVGIERIDGDRKVVVEHLSHFYDKDTVIATLPRIKDYVRYSLNDYRINNLKAGYAEQNYDQASGRYEFNTQVTYESSQRTKHSDGDYTLPFRADCYGMEFVRANLSNKQTTDAGSDNDAFLIVGSGNIVTVPEFATTAYEILRGQAVTGGLPEPVKSSVFNIALTPDRNIGRMLPFIKSNHYGLADPLLTFNTGTKNSALIAALFSIYYPVYRNIDLASDGSDILWIPEVIEVEAETSLQLAALLADNPNGVLKLPIWKKGREYNIEGFILQGGVVTGMQQSHKFKLLISPRTPLPAEL